MNRTETVALITYLNRAGLVGALEGQAAVWADVLDDIRPEDATVAAREIARTRTSNERWLTPGDIREAVKNLRRNRVLAAPPVNAPNADNSIQWRDAWTQMLAAGHHPADAYKAACEHTGDAPEQRTLDFLTGRPGPRAAIAPAPQDAWMQQ